MTSAFKRLIEPSRRWAARFARVGENEYEHSIIYKAANILAAEKVPGDYLEFGVASGRSLIRSYHIMRRVYQEHQAVHTGRRAEDAAAIRSIWESMRFVAFDSFEGLPPIEGRDAQGHDFAEGMYAFSESHFLENVTRAGVPRERVVTVPGWFQNSCVAETRERLALKQAAVIHVDCDLYSSAKVVLEFITPLMVDGTILIFDDWYCFRGHPHRGERAAFAEWSAGLPHWVFTEYQKEGPWRMSFIANRLDADPS